MNSCIIVSRRLLVKSQSLEEPKVLDMMPIPMPLPEPEPIVPYIDPRVIEEATNELQSLFSDMSR